MHPHIGSQDWVTTYGLFLMLALSTCWWLARRNAGTAGIDRSHVDLVLPLSVTIGLVGVMTVFDGKVTLIPLILICMTALFVYSRFTRLSFLALVDVFALPTVVALMIQRVGCFLAGCCWGKVAVHDWTWLTLQFPVGSFAYEQHLAAGLIAADAIESLPVHPTQLYEAVLLVPLILMLRRMGVGRLPSGSVTLAAIAGYTFVRFFNEFLRADTSVFAGSLTVTQLLCVGLFLASVAVLRMNTNALH
jgi:phosphatidylglycerol:prolipoprotein diacylglycerol transferase